MLSLAYYLLKVTVCSGLLFSYYFFVLRNKRFHQYNRFYLLGTVILSCIIPLARIKFWNETLQQQMPAIKLLKVVAASDAIVEESLKSAVVWDFNLVALVVFSFISAAIFVRLLTGIVRIAILIKSNPNKSWNNINFIFTEAKGTPFSFFKYIFWNKNIDLQTNEGKQILQHELTHVQEKHSADKLLLHLALITGWLNPFFWLIRKELNMIHEFIADEKAVSDGNTDSFSAMLLKTAYPQHSFALASSFLHSPIKRRLIMFTTSKNPRYSYLRRLMILPLLCFVIVFFSFKTKGQNLTKPKIAAENKRTDKLKGVVVTDEISKGNITNPEGTEATKKIKDSSGRVVLTITDERINTKTNNADTPAAEKALVVINGVEMTSKDFDIKNIAPGQIKAMSVFNGKSAIEKYGEKGVNGVIEITTNGIIDKSAKETSQDTAKPKFDRVFTVVENPPYYSKGMAAFADYIQNNMQYPKEAIENKKEGAVSIKFIIDEDGKLSDFKKVSDVGLGLEEEAIRLLKNSTDWKPGIQNGHKVPVEIVQQIIFSLPRKKV